MYLCRYCLNIYPLIGGSTQAIVVTVSVLSSTLRLKLESRLISPLKSIPVDPIYVSKDSGHLLDIP